jgi:formylglycine-generating enzyme required for sulfatase activity
MRRLILETRGGERPVEPEALPLAIGGKGAALALTGPAPGETVAWLGLDEGRLFVQPDEAAGTELHCNGAPVRRSRWLYHGDLLRLGDERIEVRETEEEIRLLHRIGSQGRVEDEAADGAVEAVPVEAPRTVRPVAYRPRGGQGQAGRRRRVPLSLLVLWLPVLLLALLAWYLLSSRSVLVVVEPEPDRLEIAGGLSRLGLYPGGRHLLRPGRHPLVAEKEGYRTLETEIEVGREADQSFRFSLVPLPDLLLVETGEVEGALVLLDGEEMGITPLEAFEVEDGEHVERLTIEGGGKTRRVSVELSPLWAPVTVSSAPAGATILVDGVAMGRTPATLDLGQGRHVLELTLADHEPWQRSLEVRAGEPQTLPGVALDLKRGRLSLSSVPAGAAVTVDGSYRGETPLELPLAARRIHRVELSKAGHEEESREVELDPGQRREVLVELRPRLGLIELAVTPADAELLVNGEPRGPAPASLSLVALPQQIELRREGYESHRVTLTPRPGIPQRLEVTLRTLEEVEAAETPPVIRTGQGQEMILIRGGRFRMGAPRREPGRRSNETQYDVELTRPYYLATEEVSNREFREFRPGHRSGTAGGFSLELADYPVVGVSWEDAALYCNWLSERDSLPPAYEVLGGRVVGVKPLSTGYRLPTEAEWAFAARFQGGARPTKYPWGGSLPVPPGAGNYADADAGAITPGTVPGYDDPYDATAPVDAFEPDALGLFNMGGNVAEWVHDHYGVHPSTLSGVDRDPTGPEEGEAHVIRGSSWKDYSVSELRLTFRERGSEGRSDLGFRIARYAK